MAARWYSDAVKEIIGVIIGDGEGTNATPTTWRTRLRYGLNGLESLPSSTVAMAARWRDSGSDATGPNQPIYDTEWLCGAHLDLQRLIDEMEAEQGRLPTMRSHAVAGTRWQG